MRGWTVDKNKKQKWNTMFKVGFSSPLTILTTLGLMADAVWMTTGGQGWVQNVLVLRAFIYVSLWVLRLDSFTTHYTVDFQSQCQDHGFAFLWTNNLISATLMLFRICRTRNEYLYFLFTHLIAVLTRFSMSATHLFSNCFWGLVIYFMLRRHPLPSPYTLSF